MRAGGKQISRLTLAICACIGRGETYIASVNSRHRRTLEAVFADPVSGTVEWRAIEALLVAVGCRLVEGSGSRVRFAYRGVIASFHRPHPEKEAERYQVPDARAFLIEIGVVP